MLLPKTICTKQFVKYEKAKNSHGHFSKRQKTKALPGNVLIYSLQRKSSSLMTRPIINPVYWKRNPKQPTNKPTAQTKSNPIKYTIASTVQLSLTGLHGHILFTSTSLLHKRWQQQPLFEKPWWLLSLLAEQKLQFLLSLPLGWHHFRPWISTKEDI